MNFSRLESFLQERMQTAQVPGVALALVQNGELIYSKGLGVTSIEDGGIPVTSNTLFRIGSATKPLTGIAIMRLVEQGLLDLDKPISTYVPWLRFSQPEAEDWITLRLLMSHTTGLATRVDIFGTRDINGLEHFVREQLPNIPFLVPPGKFWLYSNTGIDVAGYIAEVVSKQPFAHLLRSLVFEPLNMSSTTFDPTIAMTYPLAQAHEIDEQGNLHVQHRFAENSSSYPSGFAFSTVQDLANFAIMYLDQGRFNKQQLVTSALINAMSKPIISLRTWRNEQYGLTMAVEDYKGTTSLRHNGRIGSFACSFYLHTETRSALILLLNHAVFGFGVPVTYTILDELLNVPKQQTILQTFEPDRSSWPQYIGSYLGIYTGLVHIQVVKNLLILQMNNDNYRLNMLKEDMYIAQKDDGAPIVSVGFVREGSGKINYVVVNNGPCERTAYDPSFTPTTEILQRYSGVFTRVERFGTGFDQLTFQVEQGKLFVHSQAEQVEFLCTAINDTRFAWQRGQIDFLLNENGSVNRLLVAATELYERQA